MLPRGMTRRVMLLSTMIAGGVLAAMATAYACTTLAEIELDKSAAKPGQTINGTGKYFGNPPYGQEVVLHFNAMKGAVLWSGMPDVTGSVEFSFEVPKSASAGHYTILATQTADNGQRMQGTPVRAPLSVISTEVAKPQAPTTGGETRTESAASGAGPVAAAPEAQRQARSEPLASSAGTREKARAGRSERATQDTDVTAPSRDIAVGAVPAEESPAVSGGSSLLPLVLLFGAVLLALGSGALVLARRRSDRYAPTR